MSPVWAITLLLYHNGVHLGILILIEILFLLAICLALFDFGLIFLITSLHHPERRESEMTNNTKCHFGFKEKT